MSAAKRLKQLEDENAKLKEPLTGAMLDNSVQRDITYRKRQSLRRLSIGHADGTLATSARCSQSS